DSGGLRDAIGIAHDQQIVVALSLSPGDYIHACRHSQRSFSIDPELQITVNCNVNSALPGLPHDSRTVLSRAPAALLSGICMDMSSCAESWRWQRRKSTYDHRSSAFSNRRIYNGLSAGKCDREGM